jgi:hypothetical protein
LVINAQSGGTVMLYDPIKVDQTDSGTGTFGFNMTVRGSGGEFHWGGANEFDVDVAAVSSGHNTVTLESGSRTALLGGHKSLPGVGDIVFSLNKNATDYDFDFNLNSGAWMTVAGSNVMTLNNAKLEGDLEFNLDGTRWMPQSNAVTGRKDEFLLTINTKDINADSYNLSKTDITGATVHLMDFGSKDDPSLLTGNYVFPLLVTNEAGELEGEPTNTTAYARQGMARAYTFKVDKNGPDSLISENPDYQKFALFAYMPNQVAPHEARTLTEGRAASLGFLRASWLPDHSYQQADLALYQEGTYKSWVPFAGIDGAWVNVDTGGGGEYEVSGVNGLLGIAREHKKPGESLLTGLFVEAGYGSYDTDNTIWHDPYYMDMHGDGTLRSIGGGVMARKEWPNGVRLEGSFRAGQIENDFKSYDYIDPTTQLAVEYDETVPYYAAHIGLARTWKLSERKRFDLIGRYFWTRQDGVDAVLPNGEVVNFDTDDSHRVRLGGRMTFIRDDRREWYLGAAGEYEFAGEANASAYGYPLDAPDLGGFTGIGEIGWIYRSTQDDNFSLETGLQGYIGRMRGITGGIRMEWRF